MTTPHPHAKPVAHPHLETGVAVVALIAGLLLGVVGWVADLTDWERVYVVARAVIGVILAVLVVAALAACGPKNVQPGPVEPQAAVSAGLVVLT